MSNLNIGVFLTEDDRDKYEVVTEGEGPGWKILKGVGKPLDEEAWEVGFTTGASLVPGMEPNNSEFFTPFVEAAGFTNIHAGTCTLDGPPQPLHVDDWTGEGNRPDRFSAVFVFRSGEFTGGEYTLINRGVAIDIQDGDCVIVATNEPHGNLPRHGDDYQRLTVILCGDMGGDK